MTSMVGMAPAGLQATAAVFGVSPDIKPPPRDDVVPPVAETTNSEAAKSDLNLLKMADPSIGQHVDVKA